MSQGRSWWGGVWQGDEPVNAKVLPIAVGLIVAQLAYRGWASVHSYWAGDDFQLISQTFGPGGRSLHTLLGGISGHVMPGGLYLSWMLNRISPFNYDLATATLLLMQLLASVGLLRLLLVAFGRRWGIIPPLVVYLVTAFSVQSSVWWATGVQALPVQIAFFWALSHQVRYLQTRSAAAAVAASAWVVVGLLFYEKSVLILGAIAIVTLAYFTQGTAKQRLGQLWQRFRLSLLVNVALGAAYLALYIHFGLSFDPGHATDVPIGPTADIMVLRTWGTAIFGGPLTWTHSPGSPVSFAAPSSVLVVVCLAALVLLCRELIRSRTTSLRALLLPAFFLLANVLLVVAGRTSFIGPVIGYEFRYLSELSAVTAAALAFAIMPVIGAVEEVTPRRPSVLLDRRRPAAVACVAVALLGLTSTTRYYLNWQHDDPGKVFFSTLVSDASRLPPGTAVVDSPMPASLLWPLAYPYNTLRVLLRPLGAGFDYVTAGNDRLAMLTPDGHLGQLDVTDVHQAVPGPGSRCAYRVGHSMRTIRLDGPLVFGGWWVKLSYIATADSSITVSAGGLTQRTSVGSGLHTLYFMAGPKRFHTIRVGRLIGESTLCTNDVTVGRAQALGYPPGDIMSRTDRTFPTLNAARGIGAIMVVGTHSAYNTGQILRGWTGGPLARLDFGVAIFFVLSGFLLSRPTFLATARGGRPPALIHYLWKRALRVLPLYWLVVAVALLFDPANHGLGFDVWVRQLTLTQLYFPTLLPQSLTQMWSLCTEVAFYILLPLICWLLTRRRGRRGLDLRTVWVRAGILAALGVAWQTWYAHIPGSEGHYLQWLPGYLPWFLVGMCFAAVSADLTAFPRPHLLDRLGTDLVGCWILATGLFAIACTPVAGPRIIAMPLGWEAASKDVLYAAAAGLYLLPLVFGPEREGPVRERLSGRVAIWLGDISYGVYAIHLFVMGVLFRALGIVPFTGHFVTILVLDLAITFGLATLSYRYFEKPILRLKNHRWIVRPAPLTNDLEPLTYERRPG